MLAAAFDFKLEHEVKDNLVTIGKCKLVVFWSQVITPSVYVLVDGVHPSMALATSGGKVLIHSPYNSSNEAAANVGLKSLGLAANLAQERPEDSS